MDVRELRAHPPEHRLVVAILFIEPVIRAPASARNRADLACGGGFRDHPRGTKSVRRSQFLLEFFSISWFTPMNDGTASWWLRAGLAADYSLN